MYPTGENRQVGAICRGEYYWEQPSSANESAIENATKCLIESAIESGRKYSPKVSTQDRRYRWPYLIVIPFHNTFTMKRSAWRIRLNRIVAAVLREQGKTLWLKWKQEHAEGETFECSALSIFSIRRVSARYIAPNVQWCLRMCYARETLQCIGNPVNRKLASEI